MNTETQDYDFMQKVADAYQRPGTELSGSLRAVALKFGITRTKVRKILITLGVLESPLPEEALQFQEAGMRLQKISERLGIAISTLSMYLPYVTVPAGPGCGRHQRLLRLSTRHQWGRCCEEARDEGVGQRIKLEWTKGHP